MVRRVLRDQKPDGGWNVREPDWDVHACFDAVFILRQLGGKSEAVRRAIQKGSGLGSVAVTRMAASAHYPGRHSDMDAVYFQFGTLIQAGRLPAAKLDLPDGHTLSWGHAMQPDKVYWKIPCQPLVPPGDYFPRVPSGFNSRKSLILVAVVSRALPLGDRPCGGTGG